MNPSIDPDLETLAGARASRKLGWYRHATIYVVVNGALMLLAYFRAGHHVWPLFPALGWGFGLLMHGISAFGPGAGALRERLVERERRKLLQARERAPFA